jgi:peptidoglycan L-alanyl-D-glutamate endopeptidase CwlK
MYDSRSLEDLLPVVRGRAVSFIARAEVELDIKLIITSTYRDKDKQDALYAIGRRGIAGERIVTKCRGGDSFHQYRIAFDIFPVRNGKPVLFQEDGDEVRDPIWQSLGKIAKECGLEWGGDWRSFPEGPHFQYTGGLTLSELKAGGVPN